MGKLETNNNLLSAEVPTVSCDWVTGSYEWPKSEPTKSTGDRVFDEMFERVFHELESKCRRDWKDIQRIRPFAKAKVMNMANLTQTDPLDCLQTLVSYHLLRGCRNFYDDSYRDRKTEKGDNRRCSLFTFLCRHLDFKYKTEMTKYFALSRAFQSGRIWNKHQDVINQVGTDRLQAIDSHSEDMLAVSDTQSRANPERMVMARQLLGRHKEIQSVFGLDDQDFKQKTSKFKVAFRSVKNLARNFEMDVEDFMHAVRGVFAVEIAR